ncbi:MAG: DUF3817 domain-containing protein [Flavobacteriaceae bacterium]|nr:DUF3817 domain-containing protein [Flavobacteriaceae bacterium]
MKLLSVFRIIALLEGVSYILLLFIATPIKYMADDPTYVRILGMPHGLLFIAYIAIAVLLKPEQQWNNRTFLVILVASLIPFGTFYVDKKFLAPKK